MIIHHARDYKNHHTDGELFIDDSEERFCHVLEDIGRPFGVKIPGETCIPELTYKVTITRSTRWDKPMMLLTSGDASEGVINDGYGVQFTGIRPHGGNKIDDTHGCPICAYNSDLAGAVWNRASDDLFKLVEAELNAGRFVFWMVEHK